MSNTYEILNNEIFNHILWLFSNLKFYDEDIYCYFYEYDLVNNLNNIFNYDIEDIDFTSINYTNFNLNLKKCLSYLQVYINNILLNPKYKPTGLLISSSNYFILLKKLENKLLNDILFSNDLPINNLNEYKDNNIHFTYNEVEKNLFIDEEFIEIYSDVKIIDKKQYIPQITIVTKYYQENIDGTPFKI